MGTLSQGPMAIRDAPTCLARCRQIAYNRFGKMGRMIVESRGVIAAGNAFTAEAGAEILADGGNAFDAVIAALIASFASEPVLSSPGGGGFLLAAPVDRPTTVIDFFAQTPGRKAPMDALDFRHAEADFGTATQDFHIGKASVAVPGMIAGLFDIHASFGSLPMSHLAEPGIRLARDGHPLDPLQAEIIEVVKPIMLATAEARHVFESPTNRGAGLHSGEIHKVSQLAGFLDTLAREGPSLFYRGDVCDRMVASVDDGGLLTKSDFESFEVIHRRPLRLDVAKGELLTNPLPSAGGRLIGFGLKLLERIGNSPAMPEDQRWPMMVAKVFEATSDARLRDELISGRDNEDRILSPEVIDEYFVSIANRARKVGGTTHISAVDAKGNVASATVSNGEGCGDMVPGCGFMLNNMLGEEDLNPQGFFNWPCNTRISSMMAPSIVRWPSGRAVALGSGGSNRIRTAILQAAAQLLFFGKSLRQAVDAPRLHWEDGHLSLESGFHENVVSELVAAYPDHTIWPDTGFFFGGVHMAEISPQGMDGAADLRRGGVVRMV